MTEKTMKSTNRLLTFLVILLIAVTAVQGFFLFKLYQGTQKVEGSNEQADVRLLPQRTTPAPKASRPAQPRSGPATTPSPGLGFDPLDSWWYGGLDEWDPFAEMERMRRRMNRLFDDSFGRMQRVPGLGDPQMPGSFAPSLDLRDEGDQYVVRLDIPGAEASSVSVNVEDRLLSVSGEVNEVVEEKEGDRVLRKERRSGRFERSITLPGPVKAEQMTADYDDGVLTVTVPKGEQEAESKTLQVR